MKELDFFGEPFKLNYNGDYLFKTKFSAAVSVLTLILTSFYGIWNIILMLQHNGLIINSYQTNLSDNDYYTMDDDQFFAFQLFDRNGTDILTKNSSLIKYFSAYSMFYGFGNYTNELTLFRCNTTNNKLLPNNSNNYCLNLNRSKLGGNFYASYGIEKSYINLGIYFNYDQYSQDYANLSANDYTNPFPLSLYVITPMTIIDLLKYDEPSTYVPQISGFNLYYNTSKFIVKKTGIIEINTDVSFVTFARKTQTVFSSSPSFISEIYYDPYILVNFNYILDQTKILYFRSYMSLQNVLNNVSSAAGVFFALFGIICRAYNSYKLKVDFIEENILFKMDKEAIKEKKDIILNPPQNEQLSEPPTILNPTKSSTELNNIITKSNRRPCKAIKMKSFFDLILCCKHEETIKNQIYSEAAREFYEQLVDSKRLIILSSQFEDLKKAWLKVYQNVVFDNSKIIIDRDEMNKIKNNNEKLEINFQMLKRKIIKKKGDETDKMIIKKF